MHLLANKGGLTSSPFLIPGFALDSKKRKESVAEQDLGLEVDDCALRDEIELWRRGSKGISPKESKSNIT